MTRRLANAGFPYRIFANHWLFSNHSTEEAQKEITELRTALEVTKKERYTYSSHHQQLLEKEQTADSDRFPTGPVNKWLEWMRTNSTG